MTKKQLEKYQKEFDEFVANVEKMGGRFLTEDELRYKINGGVDGGSDNEGSQEESDSPSVEGESSDAFAGDPTEATADGAGETQAGNENEDSSGKSEEAAEEDDDKSFWDSVCDAVGGVVDAVGDAVSGAAQAVGEFIEDVIDFFTGGSKEDEKTVEETGSEPANPTNPTVGGSENSKSPDATQDKSTSENAKTNTNEGMTVDSKNLTHDSSTGTFSSKPSLSDVNLSAARPENNLAAAMEAANGKSKETVNQDEISLNLEPIENKKSSFNFEYDENLCRGYYSGNQNIGLGAGGWISSTSLDNPKSIVDDNGMHFMNIQISDNTTVHLDNIYIGCRISF